MSAALLQLRSPEPAGAAPLRRPRPPVSRGAPPPIRRGPQCPLEAQLWAAADVLVKQSSGRTQIYFWNCCDVKLPENFFLHAKQVRKMKRFLADTRNYGTTILIRFDLYRRHKKLMLRMLATRGRDDSNRYPINVFLKKRLGPLAEPLCNANTVIEGGDWCYFLCCVGSNDPAAMRSYNTLKPEISANNHSQKI